MRLTRLRAPAAAAMLAWAYLTGEMPALAQSADRPSDISQICDGCVPEKVVTCKGFLEGAVFDNSGVMWMVGLRSGEIMKIGPGKECLTAGQTNGGPNGAKFHKDGRLFIADRARGLIAFDPVAANIKPIHGTYGMENLRGLNDLIFDRAGGVYFTEPYGSSALNPNGRVFYLPPGPDGRLTLLTDRMAFPNGIALSPDESRLYVADYATNRIIAFPMQGPGALNVAFPPFVFARLNGGTGPDGMAVDTAGNLYAAHFNAGEVVVLDPRGFGFGSIRLPPGAGFFTTNIAFHEGYLYITEASKNDVWRVKTKIPGNPLYHQR